MRVGIVGLLGVALAASAGADVMVSTSRGQLFRMNPRTGTRVGVTYYTSAYTGLIANPSSDGFFALRNAGFPQHGQCTFTFATRQGDAASHFPVDIWYANRAGSTASKATMSGTPAGLLYAFEYQTLAPWDQTVINVRRPGELDFVRAGSVGFAFNGAIAVDNSGRIWCASGSISTGFFEFDPWEGSVRVVASQTGVPAIAAMAFDGPTLYAFDSRGGIYEVARDTGVFTWVASFDTTAPGSPVSIVAYVDPCLADYNTDGFVDFFDYAEFTEAFTTGTHRADVTGDGFIDFFDYLMYVEAFEAGCPG